jgi:Ig-like domain from next to BRCA1 gene
VNAGTTSWPGDASLVFSQGDQLDGPSVIPIGGAVPSGNRIDLSVTLRMPPSMGTYAGSWRLRSVTQALDFGDPVWVILNVGSTKQDPFQAHGGAMDSTAMVEAAGAVSNHHEHEEMMEL